MLVEFIAVGVLGGLVRALYGLLKAINDGALINKGSFINILPQSSPISQFSPPSLPLPKIPYSLVPNRGSNGPPKIT